MARSHFILGLIVAAGVSAAAARAQADRSPFLPPSAPEANAGQMSGPNGIELRGIMSTTDGVKYNIYNPAKKGSVWLGVNEPGDGFVIKSGDLDRDSVTVEANGQRFTLSMKQVKTNAGAFGGLPPGGVVLRPTPADEAARLQAVADEVRRRRLLREQAAAQQRAPGFPNVMPQARQ
ncbi:MAG TPA: hypothetical protein VGL42_16760 [Opitutaceae bacterium]